MLCFKRTNANKRLYRHVSELYYIFNYVPTHFILRFHIYSLKCLFCAFLANCENINRKVNILININSEEGEKKCANDDTFILFHVGCHSKLLRNLTASVRSWQ